MTSATPRCTTGIDGAKRWYVNGQIHRDDGPAIEWPDGSKEWYFEGQRHREDGPAIEWADGSKEWSLLGAKEWYLRGRTYSQVGWLREVLRDREFTPHQRDLLFALSENWEGTPALLYDTIVNLAPATS